MEELYKLLKELVELLKIKPKIRKRIKIVTLIIVLSFVAFLIIRNNFFNNDKKDLSIDISNSENSIVNTGNNNKIVLDKSNKYFTSQDTNAKEYIEEYLKNPDIPYEFHTIKKEGYKPYYLLVYLNHDSIFFEAIKIKNEKIIVLNKLTTRDIEFIVGSWRFEPLMDNEYLLFTGCRPHACHLEFGMYLYSLKYNEGYAISTDESKGFTIINLPSKISTLCDFENIILSDRAELLDKVQENGSIFDFLPSRKLPNIVDSVDFKDKLLFKIKECIKDTLKNPKLLSKLQIYGLYRENFFKNGLCWLTAAAINDNNFESVVYCFFNDKFELIYSFKSSYLFGDTGDIYIIKNQKDYQINSNYLMIVKDCGGTSGIQEIWMYKIISKKLSKVENADLIEKYLEHFKIDNYRLN